MQIIINLKSKDIEELLKKIYESNFDKHHIGMLFMLLRPLFGYKKNNMLLDISNFIAHGDKRDRGLSYDYIHAYVDNFVHVSEVGGTIAHRPIFSKQKVVEQLIKTLEGNFKFKIYNNKIRKNTNKIVDCLIDQMDNVEFKFSDPRVMKCNLKKIAGTIYFQLHFNLEGPVIKVSKGGIIQISLFD